MGERVRDSLHISERMWQDKVEQLAILNGWWVDHKTPMRYASGHVRTTGLPGMPDLTLIHPAGHGFIMAELKTDKGRLSEEQERWGSWVERAGGLYVPVRSVGEAIDGVRGAGK